MSSLFIHYSNKLIALIMCSTVWTMNLKSGPYCSVATCVVTQLAFVLPHLSLSHFSAIPLCTRCQPSTTHERHSNVSNAGLSLSRTHSTSALTSYPAQRLTVDPARLATPHAYRLQSLLARPRHRARPCPRSLTSAHPPTRARTRHCSRRSGRSVSITPRLVLTRTSATSTHSTALRTAAFH